MMNNNYTQLEMFDDTLKVAEKLEKRGGSALTDFELLQVLVGAGADNTDATETAKKISAVIEKVGADMVTMDDLKAIPSVGTMRAALVLASIEYFSRKLTKKGAPLIDSPEKAAKQFDEIRGEKQEHFVLLTLNGARRLIKKHVVSIGTLMSSLVHPREVFSLAIEDRAASIIVGHNHPSGQLDISENDREVTSRLRKAGDIIGIRLDDHIIVAGDDFVSAY